MTDRDLFACAALGGLLARPGTFGTDWIPARAYELADLMMTARAMEPKPSPTLSQAERSAILEAVEFFGDETYAASSTLRGLLERSK
jgi:hypothetical protein